MPGGVDPRAAKAHPAWGRDRTYRALLRHALLRLIFLYFIPLLLLTVFFHIEYRLLVREAEQRHLQVLAEHQAPAGAANVAPSDPGDPEGTGTRLLANISTNLWMVTAVFCVFGGLVIWLQARWVAAQQFAALRKEQELQRQLVHSARLASIGELAAGIAHEINNPLAVVAENAGLVKDLLDPRFARTATPAEIRDHLGVIEKSVYRATSITRRLLGFVRQADVRLVERDLHELVDELLEGILKSELTSAGVRVVRDYDDDLGPVVTDPDQLRQVLLNLLKNAADAVAGDGLITVRTRRSGDRFRLEVADDGPGMTDEQLERVFLPFFTTKDPDRGTGLGLSVSYGIVEGLGGRLTVASRPGEGSVFTIDQPLRR